MKNITWKLIGSYWIYMSGLNEIIQWSEANIELDSSQSSEENFNDINQIFEADGRSDLSDILGDEKGKFLEWIEERTKQLPEDIQIKESEGLLSQVSNFLRGLFR